MASFRESAQMTYSSNPKLNIFPLAAYRNRGVHLHGRIAVPSNIYSKAEKGRATENKKKISGWLSHTMGGVGFPNSQCGIQNQALLLAVNLSSIVTEICTSSFFFLLFLC